MKALVLSPVCPCPPNTGGLVRIYNLAKELGRHFEVTLVSPVDAEGAAVQRALGLGMDFRGLTYFVPTKTRKPWSRVASVLSRSPYHVAHYFSAEMAAKVEELLQSHNFSFVYCNFLYTFPYVKRETSKPAIILDQHNVDRVMWSRKAAGSRSLLERLASRFNGWKTVRFEDQWLKRIGAYVSVSKLDKELTLQYAYPQVKNVFVAPNGVDLERFKPRERHSGSDGLTLGFLGSLDVKINQDAVQFLIKSLLPRIRKHLAAQPIHLVVIGRNPPAHLLELGKVEGVDFTGTVDDVNLHLNKVDIMVCPLMGGAGTKLRLFEALACGLPVVGSKFLFEGVDEVFSGQVAYEAEDVEEYCAHIASLAADRNLRLEVGQRGRKIVETHYSWRVIGDRLASDIMTSPILK